MIAACLEVGIHDNLAQTPIPEIGQGVAVRAFVIWNRGYKTQVVIAEDAREAIQVSLDSRHITKPNAYRKFADCTGEFLSSEDYPEIEKALALGKAGVYQRTEEGWTLGGQLVE